MNLVEPDARTMEELGALFGFHPLALEDATSSDLPAKVEVYDDVVFVIARTIVWTEEIDTDQLSLFLGKQFLVTIEGRVFPQLEDVRVQLRKRNPRLLKSGPDFLLYTILDRIVSSYFPHMDRFQDILDGLEDEVIRQPTGRAISRVHSVRTDLTLVRNALRPQRDTYGTLARLELPMFHRETKNYLRDVQDHMTQVLDSLDTYREIATSLMDLGANLASNQLNEIIKVLTVLFTITIPLTVVTGAFGMNVPFPGFGEPAGLWLALALMILPTALVVLWLRTKGWLRSKDSSK